jgi:hypothetical protein
MYSTNGVFPLDRFGAFQLSDDAAAPNGVDFGATVVVSEGNPRVVTITLPVADYSAYSSVNLGWLADSGDGVMVAGSASFVPVSGDIVLDGTEVEVFGAAAGLDVQKYQLCPIDSSGRMAGTPSSKALPTPYRRSSTRSPSVATAWRTPFTPSSWVRS